jgi:predicted PurR-regulated permease PerM
MKITNYAALTALIVFFFYILHIGYNILMPLAVSIVFWYIISSITEEFQRIKLFRKNISYAIGLTLSLVTCAAIFYFFINLMNSNINEIIASAPEYQAKLNSIIAEIYKTLEIEQTTSLDQIIGNTSIASIAGSIAGAITILASHMLLILIFLIFLLLEYRSFDKKLAIIIKDKDRFKEIHNIFTRINKDIHEYIRIKTIVSLLTAILSYGVLLFFEVDFAAFWGILIFMLNFIPNIGSIIAVIFPVTITLIQFDTFIPFIVCSIVLSTIQFVIGNILEPKMMGNSLNLSPFVIILSLALWGNIWGIIGMFLCVPIMVIINIILARLPKTKWIAVLLSADGKVN